jgi:hypothetical protein
MKHFFFILLSLVCFQLKAQQTHKLQLKKSTQLFFQKGTILNDKKNTGSVSFSSKSNVIIPSNFHLKSFGFFCHKELQFEKATKIPFRFRLGSMDYVNQLEGKR